MKKFPVFLDISTINTADGEALNRIVEGKYRDTYKNIDVTYINKSAKNNEKKSKNK